MSLPPPPPENPILQLKRHNTAPELRKELNELNLSEKGSKSDLCIRLVKHKSGIITKETKKELVDLYFSNCIDTTLS